MQSSTHDLQHCSTVSSNDLLAKLSAVSHSISPGILCSVWVRKALPQKVGNSSTVAVPHKSRFVSVAEAPQADAGK